MPTSVYKILAIVVVVALVAAGWLGFGAREAPVVTDYSLTQVQRGNITQTVSATGTLSPVNTVQVGSQVSGTIQSLYVDFNSQVKRGQVIARIDDAIFRARLAEAEANLKNAEAVREKAWVTVQDAQRQLRRQEELHKQQLVAESVVDAARFGFEAARVEHKVQEAAVSQARAARDRERVNLEYATIYAPIDGVVISRDVDVGQTVAASLQAPTLFTIARDLTRMQIETDVDEAFIGMIEEQQPVVFTVFAYPDRTFEGRVAQVRLQPKVEAGVVKYNCIIHVENTDLALKPGMTAMVDIEVARHEGVLKVASSALRYVPDWPQEQIRQLRAGLQPNEAILWRPHRDSLQPVTVRVGVVGDKETEVSSGELDDGATVALPKKADESERRRRFGLSLF